MYRAISLLLVILFQEVVGQNVLFKVVDNHFLPIAVTIQVKNSKGEVLFEVPTNEDGTFIYKKCCDPYDQILIKSELYYVPPTTFSTISGQLVARRMPYSSPNDYNRGDFHFLQPSDKAIKSAVQIKSLPPNKPRKITYRSSTLNVTNSVDVSFSCDIDSYLFINNKRTARLSSDEQVTLALNSTDTIFKVVAVSNYLVSDSTYIVGGAKLLKSISFELKRVSIEYYNRAANAYNAASKLHDERKYAQSLDSLKIALFYGNARAGEIIACMYTIGDVIKADYDSAFLYYNRANERGADSINNNLAILYLHGLGVKQNVQKGVEILTSEANKGSATAIENLARCYIDGFGVKRSYSSAFRYLSLAASRGVANCQDLLGVLYFYGWGVEMDRSKADEIFLSSAEKGYSSGQDHLGQAYVNGFGVSKNDSAAYYWLTRAAQGGSPEGEYHLGLYYLNQKKPKYDSVHYWMVRAAERNNPKAENFLGGSCLTGAYFNRKDTACAFSLLTASAQSGYLEGQFNLGLMYLNGCGTKIDSLKAIHWFQLSAEAAYLESESILAEIYFNKKDYKTAFHWYSLCMKSRDSKAIGKIGYMIFFGLGTKKDQKYGVQFFKDCAERGDVQCMMNLAHAYRYGEGAPKDDSISAYWLAAAARQGFPDAQFHYARLLYEGRGVKKDDMLSKYWLRKAAESGYSEAQFQLGKYYMDGMDYLQSDKQAAFWFNKAAEQGSIEASGYLGILIYEGRGNLPEDTTTGKRMIEAALQIESFNEYVSRHRIILK